MNNLDINDIGFIMGIVGIIGVIFTIYKYFRDPQISTDKKDALLAQQVQWSSEATERRFKEMNDNFQALLLQSNNHIHTVDTKVEALNLSVTNMGKEIVKLATIIDERMPKKLT